ncbi:hypothetical protein SAMN05518865_11690 [Duganella sp. CF458]|uniref:hypothetical protein n=1 Tax=Duganella sp. CF458 TaxID=1884368 RepID=UPI0008F1576E|nr:hypothetical protein [Duganella sp. CF458]SFG69787.1 hypothetical protein SAMN05518865_11690 [Duganella sp. CF458]
MIKIFTVAALSILFAGCANVPDQAAGEQKYASQDEVVEQTGSHLKRKRQTVNMEVIDRDSIERNGRPHQGVNSGTGR